MDQRPAMDPSVSEIESFLGQIAGVIAARAVPDDWGAVTAVHLLVASERSPKVILLDTQRRLKERFNLALDHKRISIAQKLEIPKAPEANRAILRHLHTKRDLNRSETKVIVELAVGTDLALFTGEATGVSHAKNIIRIAADAALQAVNAAILPGNVYELAAQQELKIANQEVVLTLLRLHSSHGTEELAGVSMVREERVYAAVRSCLEAVNRRLGSLLPNAAEQPGLGASEIAASEEAE